MQSPLIKFRCGHEVALPLDERGKDLEDKIAMLSKFDCPTCLRNTWIEEARKCGIEIL